MSRSYVVPLLLFVLWGTISNDVQAQCACNNRINANIGSDAFYDLTAALIIEDENTCLAPDITDFAIELRDSTTNAVILRDTVSGANTAGALTTILAVEACSIVGPPAVIMEVFSLINGEQFPVCWGHILFEDKTAPTFLACAPDVTIGCNISKDPGSTTTATRSITTSDLPVVFGRPGTATFFHDVTLSTGELPINAILTDVNVSIELEHPQVSDLRISLMNPNGSFRALIEENPGDCDEANMNITIDDESFNTFPPDCSTTNPAYSGTVRSNDGDDLRSFSGLYTSNLEGDWILRINDLDRNDGFDQGVIRNVSMDIGYRLAPLQSKFIEVDSSFSPIEVGDGASHTVQISMLSLPSDVVLTDINLSADVLHPDIYQLSVDLTNPTGTISQTILDQSLNLACTGANLDVDYFDDEGSDFACSNTTSPAITGNIQPTSALDPPAILSNFYGLEGIDARGDPLTTADEFWEVEISDLAGVGTASINSVGLKVSFFSPSLTPPIAIDNCNNDVSISHNDDNNITSCGVGTITRTWTATDVSGNTQTCTQTITCLRDDNIIPAIQWPKDTTLLCDSGITLTDFFSGGLNPSQLETLGWDRPGCPISNPLLYPANHMYCGNIAFSFRDASFELCNQGFKILRTWQAYDWCTSTQIGNDTTQVIMVVDTIAPIISNCETVITVNVAANACTADVSDLTNSISVEDACDDTVTITAWLTDSTGAIIVDLTQVPKGAYNIHYQATDDCNNFSTCSSTLNVADITAPELQCNDATITVPIENGVDRILTVTDLINNLNVSATDNCSDALIFEMSQDGTIWTDSLTFTCVDLQNDTIWVRVSDDCNGNGIIDTDDNTSVSSCDIVISLDKSNCPCENITDAGTIGANQSGCTPFDPISIDNLTLPTGGDAADVIVYQWYSTTTLSEVNINTWNAIQGATNSSHDPASLSQTTYFARCARRDGCTDFLCTDSIVITVNSLPSVNAGSSSPICDGETLDLTESGGDATSWQWTSSGNGTFSSTTAQNPNVMGVANGDTFTIIVTDGNGCTNSATTTATVNTLPIATLTSVTPETCPTDNNGAIDISVSNGSGNYTYTWSDAGATTEDRTDLSQGTYSVTVTDATTSCTGILSDIQVDSTCFDLALLKSLVGPAQLAINDTVTFSILVVNQGNVDAYNILVEDRFLDPGYWNFNESDPTNIQNGWVAAPNENALAEIVLLESGQSTTLDIRLSWNGTLPPTNENLTNISEIFYADDNEIDTDADPIDIDSTVDNEVASEDDQDAANVLFSLDLLAVAPSIEVFLNDANPNEVRVDPTIYGSESIGGEGNLNYSLSKSAFTCDDLGANIVYLTVTDDHGNTDQATGKITVIDQLAPTIENEVEIHLSLPASGVLSLTTDMIEQKVSDNCSIASISFNPSEVSIVDMNSSPKNIVATIEDGSGNSTKEIIRAYIHDDQAPNIECKSITQIELDENGLYIPTFNKVVQSADDMEGGTLQFSFTPLYIDCNSLGDQVRITSTAIDPSGNTSSCEIYVTVLDNGSTCILPRIAGSITTPSGIAKSDVRVEANGDQMYAMTGIDGTFEFNNLEKGEDYMLEAKSNNNYLENVSTWDILLLRKHLLGLVTFDNPYNYVAADVNNDKVVSAADILELRKVILSQRTAFTNNTAWRYIDSEYEFPASGNPLQTTIPEIHECYSVIEDQMYQDFVAVKVGDINGSYIDKDITQNRQSGGGEIAVTTTVNELKGEIEYSFETTTDIELNALQLGLNFGTRIDRIVSFQQGALRGLDKDNFGLSKLSDGIILLSWDDVYGRKTGAGTVLFSVRLRLDVNKASFSIGVDQFESLIGSGGNKISHIVVKETDHVDNEMNVRLFQNVPNPFSGQTKISFEALTSGSVKVNVLDLHGKMVHSESMMATEGMNELTLDARIFSGAGLYYYELIIGEDSFVKKMLYSPD